jgi:hypothetical protein
MGQRYSPTSAQRTRLRTPRPIAECSQFCLHKCCGHYNTSGQRCVRHQRHEHSGPGAGPIKTEYSLQHRAVALGNLIAEVRLRQEREQEQKTGAADARSIRLCEAGNFQLGDISP